MPTIINEKLISWADQGAQSTRSWPTRPTWWKFCTLSIRFSTTREPDQIRDCPSFAAVTGPGGQPRTFVVPCRSFLVLPVAARWSSSAELRSGSRSSAGTDHSGVKPGQV
jgi:hypothetical protein